MADHKIFSFNLEGIEEMTEALDLLLERIDERVDKKMLELANDIIHDAKRLAPNLSGDLEGALIVGEIKRLIGLSYIDFGAGRSVDSYSVVQHEGFMHRKGKLVPLTPGEETLSKGAYNGELPGKKFLERAIKMNEKRIIEELSKVLEG